MKIISVKRIKSLAGNENKKISKKALEKIAKVIEKKVSEIIRKSSIRASFSGRRVIREEDIVE